MAVVDFWHLTNSNLRDRLSRNPISHMKHVIRAPLEFLEFSLVVVSLAFFHFSNDQRNPKVGNKR